MLKILFPGRTIINGLELGCNYGPYLHFLENKRGITGIRGAEIDELAVEYAQRNGVPVDKMNAANLPLESNSQEVVLSNNFLCPTHFQGHRGEEIMDSIAREIMRVLRPGGIYVSSLDDAVPGISVFAGFQTFSCERRYDVLAGLRIWYKPES